MRGGRKEGRGWRRRAGCTARHRVLLVGEHIPGWAAPALLTRQSAHPAACAAAGCHTAAIWLAVAGGGYVGPGMCCSAHTWVLLRSQSQVAQRCQPAAQGTQGTCVWLPRCPAGPRVRHYCRLPVRLAQRVECAGRADLRAAGRLRRRQAALHAVSAVPAVAASPQRSSGGQAASTAAGLD